MRESRRCVGGVMIVLATSAVAAGCVLVAAGAGAGGAVYATSRGVESVVVASGDEAFAAAERAFRELGIKRTSFKVDDEGGRRELKGTPSNRDVEVTVTLRSEGPRSTRVEVTARESLVKWDKDYARTVIERIVEYAG